MNMAWIDAFALIRADSRLRLEDARLDLLIARAAQVDDKQFKTFLDALDKP